MVQLVLFRARSGTDRIRAQAFRKCRRTSLRTDRRTRSTGSVSAICLLRFFGHELVEAFAFMLLFVSLMYQRFANLNRYLFKSIRQVENSVSTETGDLHPFQPHTCPLDSVFSEECVFLNYDHGAQQALPCEYVDLGSHPTYFFLDSDGTRAMGSRFALIALYRLANNIRSVTTFGFPSNHVQVSFYLQMENNLLSKKD